MTSQPRALYLLNFVSMWECFSYYGMRVLLVLFMIHEFHFSDSSAFSLYALYTTLVELGGVIGGIVADRYLGLKRCIFLGGWTIALGHLCLAIPNATNSFFLGLGLIIVGTSLFRSNVAALLGCFYMEKDPRRDAGFTLYYAGINIGGFLASILCGLVGETYGWHAGFSLAALGMLSGNIALLYYWKLLIGKGDSPHSINRRGALGGMWVFFAALISAVAIYNHEITTLLIPLMVIASIGYIWYQIRGCTKLEIAKFRRLGLYLILMILFFGCEEQLGSSLVLFADRHVDRTSIFGIIPAASLIMFNPLTILLIGPYLSRVMKKFPMDGFAKIGLSFFLLSIAFLILYLACVTMNTEGIIALRYAIGSILMISLGEIFIGPTIYAYASEASPQKLQGLVMGMVTMGFSMANFFSGWISQLMAVVDIQSSLGTYKDGFEMIGLSALAIALTLFLINNGKKVFV